MNENKVSQDEEFYGERERGREREAYRQTMRARAKTKKKKTGKVGTEMNNEKDTKMDERDHEDRQREWRELGKKM